MGGGRIPGSVLRGGPWAEVGDARRPAAPRVGWLSPAHVRAVRDGSEVILLFRNQEPWYFCKCSAAGWLSLLLVRVVPTGEIWVHVRSDVSLIIYQSNPRAVFGYQLLAEVVIGFKASRGHRQSVKW